MRTKEERRKVMLLVLPVVILPLLALVFFALGGGRADAAKVIDGGVKGSGVNVGLPDAKFGKDKQPDKFSLYEQAKQDSLRKGRIVGVFGSLGWDTAAYRRSEARSFKERGASAGFIGSGGSVGPGSAGQSEAKIREKLAEISKAVNAPAVPAVSSVPASLRSGGAGLGSSDAELVRLEKLLHRQQVDRPGADPELERLNGMLDKIVAIQHPGAALGKDSLGLVKRKVGSFDTVFKAVPAVVDGNQKVLQGGLVRLRLMDSLVLGGICFHAGQLLFGSCTVSNQRLFLEIRNIRLGTAIVPVNLTVFSLDGMAGIDAPEAELGKVAGQGTANALGNMEFLGMDQSIAMQAASAGISAAKGLIGRKIRKVKVHLKGGYPVLLRNNQAGGH